MSVLMLIALEGGLGFCLLLQHLFWEQEFYCALPVCQVLCWGLLCYSAFSGCNKALKAGEIVKWYVQLTARRPQSMVPASAQPSEAFTFMVLR